MDPVTVVSLVSNIVQLVQAGQKIVITAKEVRQSANGLTEETESFRKRAELIRQGVDILLKTNTTLNNDETFRGYIRDLRTRVDTYIRMLENLGVKDQKSGLQPLKVALKAWWKKNELESSFRLIDEMSNKATMHLINVHLPLIDAKLDDLYIQGEGFGSSMSREVGDLRVLTEQLNSTNESNHNLLQAIQERLKKRETTGVEPGCLRALYFNQIYSRKERVKPAHLETFQWILDDEAIDDALHDANQHKFRQWLRCLDADKNVFWISGKPGSGKSTLMKFLVGHSKLQQQADEWIGARKVLVVDYFFWRPGTYLQRSLKGLLRSLIFQILKERRDFIASAFPRHEWMISGDQYEFTQTELLEALRKIIVLAQEEDFRILFFIDGLDEFDDRDDQSDIVPDERELLDTLGIFSNSPAVKLCVSSRPWSAFQKKFGQDVLRTFPIHELTKNDIKKYIDEKLVDNPDFQSLDIGDVGRSSLVEELLQAAQGVFLWVYFATRALLDGIDREDRLWQLQDKIRKLPPKLKDLYSHILSSIAPEYWPEVARALMVAGGENGTYPLSTLVMNLCFDDHERARIEALDIIDLDEWHRDLERTKNRILAESKGLLEIEDIDSSDTNRFGKLSDKYFRAFRSARIEFTHRSLVEFATSDTVKQRLIHEARMSSTLHDMLFRALIAILHAILQFVGQFGGSEFHFHGVDRNDLLLLNGGSPIERIVSHHFKACTKLVQYFDEDSRSSYWESLCDVMTKPFKDTTITLLHHKRGGNMPNADLRVLFGLEVGSSRLVRRYLEVVSGSCKASLPPSELFRAFHAGRFDVIGILLEHGSDPNEHVPSLSPATSWWGVILQQVFCWPLVTNQVLEAVASFVRGGADLTSEISVKVVSRSVGRREKAFDTTFHLRTDNVLCYETVTFTAADVIRFFFKDGGHDLEDVLSDLPAKTDYRETPEQVMVRWGMTKMLKRFQQLKEL